jgi:hypothetical protein
MLHIESMQVTRGSLIVGGRKGHELALTSDESGQLVAYSSVPVKSAAQKLGKKAVVQGTLQR